jgi:hypothetical protein
MVYSKSVFQSRQIAGTPLTRLVFFSVTYSHEAYVTKSSLTLKYSDAFIRMHCAYLPLLREIQKKAEDKLDVKFNHVVLDLYGDGGRILDVAGAFRRTGRWLSV